MQATILPWDGLKRSKYVSLKVFAYQIKEKEV